MSGLSRTPGKRVYGESRTAGSNPALSATQIPLFSLATPRISIVFEGLLQSAIEGINRHQWHGFASFWPAFSDPAISAQSLGNSAQGIIASRDGLRF